LREAMLAPPFFRSEVPRRREPGLVPPPRNRVLVFGWWPLSLEGSSPDWHWNLFTGTRVPHPERDWWSIPDFDEQIGDIKAIWEISRFDWVLALLQQAVAGDTQAINELND